MTEPTPRLSLVILAYRSGAFARTFAERTLRMLEANGIDSFELILVGNYFPEADDPTPEVVRELAAEHPHIRCQVAPKEGYMGWDLRSGLRRARGEIIAFIDGDGQMPIEDVGRLMELMEGERYDLVKTYRVERADGWRRWVFTTVYNAVFHILFPGLASRDINAKPKMFRRAAYERMTLRDDGWFIDAEIMLEARRLGLRIGELPTSFHGLQGRESFVNYGAALEFVRKLLRSRLRSFFG